jgi:tRNA(Glu) U13 pseudouridine synthase TruD
MGRLFADELVVSVHALGLEVAFALPKGAFATTLLREFMKDESTVLPPEETESFD